MMKFKRNGNRPRCFSRGRLFFIPVIFILSLPVEQASSGEIQFNERGESLRVDFVHRSGAIDRKDYIFETKGGGLLVVDLDGDDIPELYFVSASTRDLLGRPDAPRNALYKRQADGTYRECAAEAGLDDPGWGMGGCAGDLDNDGDIDLYVTNFGPNRLYINRGDGTFSEEAEARGVGCPAMSTGSSFGDADGDGFIDLYVCNYIAWTWDTIPTGPERFGNWRGMTVHAGPRGLPKAADRLFRNRGDGTFEDWSERSGVARADPQYGFQPVWFDADLDGDSDIFVSNDSCPNYLFINQGRGEFVEDAFFRGVAYSNDGGEQGSMGVDLADVNGDGVFDIVMTAWAQENNCLYQSVDKGQFEDRAFAAGFGAASTPLVGWGVVFLDYDNDGDEDLYFSNGHVFPESDRPGLGTSFRQPDFLYRNDGRGCFTDVSEKQGIRQIPMRIGRGAAIGDLDGDGDLDIVVQNLNEHPFVWINDGGSDAGHWLRVRCVASANCNPIGTIVEAYTGDKTQRRLVSSGKSVFSQCETTVHFGLGNAAFADRVVVHVPHHPPRIFEKVAANQLLVVDFGEKQ